MRRPLDPALSARLDWAVTRMEAMVGDGDIKRAQG